MSLAIVYSRAAVGVDAPLVTVEVHLTGGLPRLSIVGLPEAVVRESRDRVRSAVINAGFEFPRRGVTVGLAPAELPKHGARFDLPIAVGVLCAARHVDGAALQGHELVGELGLAGDLRPVGAALPAALAARDAGRALVVPVDDGQAAGLARGARVLPAHSLLDVCAHLAGDRVIQPRCTREVADSDPQGSLPDLAEVRGQLRARRAVEIAAAGGHGLLLIGPPGTGKTMLATRLPGLLPRMSEAEALESAAVWSVSRHSFDAARWRRRPFRAPHHTASAAALVGGGSRPVPGEISLAHNGVLFLDELPEFDRRVLESLREPLESGRIVISRASLKAEFPAGFQFVCAMNPCPCGHQGDGTDRCACPGEQVRRYRARISGPLLDRIDVQVETSAHSVDPDRAAAGGSAPPESSAAVRERVLRARDRQHERQGRVNAGLSPHDTRSICGLTPSDRRLLDKAVETLGLSGRAVDRVKRVARTIADLGGESGIGTRHLTEALSYRELERRRR